MKAFKPTPWVAPGSTVTHNSAHGIAVLHAPNSGRIYNPCCCILRWLSFQMFFKGSPMYTMLQKSKHKVTMAWAIIDAQASLCNSLWPFCLKGFEQLDGNQKRWPRYCVFIFTYYAYLFVSFFLSSSSSMTLTVCRGHRADGAVPWNLGDNHPNKELPSYIFIYTVYTFSTKQPWFRPPYRYGQNWTSSLPFLVSIGGCLTFIYGWAPLLL